MTVTVTEKKQNVWAADVVLTDEIPAGLQLLEGQYSVQTSPGAASAVLSAGRQWMESGMPGSQI